MKLFPNKHCEILMQENENKILIYRQAGKSIRYPFVIYDDFKAVF